MRGPRTKEFQSCKCIINFVFIFSLVLDSIIINFVFIYIHFVQAAALTEIDKIDSDNFKVLNRILSIHINKEVELLTITPCNSVIR